MKKLSPPTLIPERAVFHAMEWDEPWAVPGYRRNLPHWRLTGATYFVTFRLADSIPEAVARLWQEEQAAWYQQHRMNPAWASDPARRHEAMQAVPRADRDEFQRAQQRKFLVELDQCHGSCVLDAANGPVSESLLHFHGQRV